jgi:hypothetical protein
MMLSTWWRTARNNEKNFKAGQETTFKEKTEYCTFSTINTNMAQCTTQWNFKTAQKNKICNSIWTAIHSVPPHHKQLYIQSHQFTNSYTFSPTTSQTAIHSVPPHHKQLYIQYHHITNSWCLSKTAVNTTQCIARSERDGSCAETRFRLSVKHGRVLYYLINE